MNQNTYLTGAQPSNRLHIGNLLGSILNIAKFKDQTCYIFAADLHSCTTNNKTPRNMSLDLLRYYHHHLPHAYFYIQSDFPEITLLAWLLCCNTTIGQLEQMTQFKDKSKQNGHKTCGLLTYPILMAADIVILNANYVPVGQDQQQHLEFARDIIKATNNNHQLQLKVPSTLLSEEKKIFDLRDPRKKMSKSNHPNGTIFLDDNEETVNKKIQKALSDSYPMPTYYNQDRIAVNNLINLYCYITNQQPEAIYKTFGNQQISIFKNALSKAMNQFLQQNQPSISLKEMEQIIQKHKPIISNLMQKQIQNIKQKIFN